MLRLCMMTPTAADTFAYHSCAMQAGVSVTSWVFGHQVIDMVGLVLHPLLFFAWMYVLTLTPVPAETYLLTLGLVGFYTSGLGYLVRPLLPPDACSDA